MAVLQETECGPETWVLLAHGLHCVQYFGVSLALLL